MAKERNRTIDYTVYLVVRLIVAVLRGLPYGLACRAADGLAWVVRHLDKRHRLVARENLQHAFPGEYDEAALDERVAQVYRHFCRMLVEILHLDRRVHILNWRRHLSYASTTESSQLIGMFLSGRPILLVTPHFGNWELSSFIMGLLGFKMYAIARPLDNVYLDDWFRRWRESTGQKMLAKKGDFDRIEEVLKAGNILGTLGDQDAGARGVFVPFFNRPASTHKAIALLAIEHRVPMVVVGTARIGDPMVYRVYIEDVILPEEYADQPGAVKAITERFTAALERLIRRHPEQYFWLHRRWKHQPPVKQKKGLASERHE